MFYLSEEKAKSFKVIPFVEVSLIERLKQANTEYKINYMFL